ncbi:hypothetical protein FLL45_12845 [Aliikangiella marina]|uniref:Thioesterase putative domain-containing protein n=1 Tax=Aliikangiella marina TaxID=1712262 RepID=A0A545T960_9GAMM|nr:YiiD C-terminal domain-containing protein [Aliikangiella marina]TQV73752.1 hypothetical protein FLL45_12845 [Aliikangiella marina]
MSEQLKKQFQMLVNDTIPISKAIEWQIENLDPFNILAQVALKPNINIHGTVFAGSIYASAMATGWTLCQCWQQENGFKAELVAAEANIQYLAPVESDFLCAATIDIKDKSYDKLVARLEIPKSCGYRLKVEVICNDLLCAILTINFVFKS